MQPERLRIAILLERFKNGPAIRYSRIAIPLPFHDQSGLNYAGGGWAR